MARDTREVRLSPGGAALYRSLAIGLAALSFVAWDTSLLSALPRALAQAILLYLACIYLYQPLHFRLPASWRPVTLLAVSLAFYALALSAVLALLYAAGVLALLGILLLRRRSKGAVLLFAVWLAFCYGWMPLHVLRLGPAAGDLVTFRAPFDTAMLTVLVLARSFRRSIFCFYEVAIGRVPHVPPLALLNYMLGLPFLTNSATPSFRHFLDSEALTPETLEAAVARGVRTCGWCLACLGLWTLLLSTPAWLALGSGYPVVFDAPVALRQQPLSLWITILSYHLLTYLRRAASEQLSVGAWRLLGRDLRDNFVSPLASPNLIEYWRRWDVLWREFLMSVIYYPIALGLSRRSGGHQPWMAGVAGWATFAGGTVFEFMPVGLFMALADPTLAKDFFLSLCIYHFLWGILVGGSLWEAADRDRAPAHRGRSARAVQTAATYALVSLIRVFEIPFLSLAVKLQILRHALMLG